MTNACTCGGLKDYRAKLCCDCFREKQILNKKPKTRTGGSQHKVNGKTHYERNSKYYIEKSTKRRIEATNFILGIRKKSKCMDCDEKDFRVLQFDHLPKYKKDLEVSTMAFSGYSLKSIQKEIDKCQIVCANCHSIRTYNRRRCGSMVEC